MNFAEKLRRRLLRHAFPLIVSVNIREPTLVRLGTDYGGWWVCPSRLNADSICYTAGVGTDVSFDLELIARFGCRVWGIDPTPKSVEWVASQSLDPRFSLVPVGLADSKREARMYSPRNPEDVSHSLGNLQGTDTFVVVPVARISDVMRELGHDHVDLLKMDIEGAEHMALGAMLDDRIHPSMLCVEFDEPQDVRAVRATLARLRGAGYGVAKVEGFNVLLIRGGTRA